MIDHRHRYIFIHIPKTAGVSIYHMLGRTHEQNHRCRLDYAEEYFSFAVVRDPIDRFLSAITYLRSGGRGNPGDLFAQTVLNDYESLVQIADNLEAIQSRFIEFHVPANGPHILGIPHLLPQSLWTHEGECQVVDYLCRFESLREDLEKIRKLLGVRRVRLGQMNRSDRADLSGDLDARSMEKVREYYSSDVIRFGYET